MTPLLRSASSFARSLRLRDSGIHQQTRNNSRHLAFAEPFITQERSRKRKLAAPSRSFAALGTQNVARKKENALGVIYRLFVNTQEYRNRQSGVRLTRE
jgi:hypothetical protein